MSQVDTYRGETEKTTEVWPGKSEHSITEVNDSRTNMTDPLLGETKFGKIYSFKESVPLDYDDIFIQPSNSRETKLGETCGQVVVGSIFRTLFRYTQAVIYYLLAIPLGGLLTIVWGILFGLFQFLVVWVIQPVIKLSLLIVWIPGILYRALLRMVLDPIAEAFSLCYNNISSNVRMRVAGVKLSNKIDMV